jgi:hypothetical protein
MLPGLRRWFAKKAPEPASSIEETFANALYNEWLLGKGEPELLSQLHRASGWDLDQLRYVDLVYRIACVHRGFAASRGDASGLAETEKHFIGLVQQRVGSPQAIQSIGDDIAKAYDRLAELIRLAEGGDPPYFSWSGKAIDECVGLRNGDALLLTQWGMTQIDRFLDVVRVLSTLFPPSASGQEPTSTSPRVQPDNESAAGEPDLDAVRHGLAAQTRMLGLLAHLPGGVPLAEVPQQHLMGTLMITAKGLSLRLPAKDEHMIRAIGGFQLPPDDVLEALTGCSLSEWKATFARYQRAVLGAISSRSEVWDLPDDIWAYLAAMTGLSKEQWRTLPRDLGKVIADGFECPSCQTHLDPPKMIHSEGAGSTYLGKENPDLLHFACPSCGGRFAWSVTSGVTAGDM